MGTRQLRIGAKDVVIALSLLGAGAYGGWIGLAARGSFGPAWTDGVRAYRGLADVRYAVWDAPEELPGDANSLESEGRAALSPDGRFLVFAVGERGLGADLYAAELVDGAARDARPVTALCSAFDELAPAFGPDALYFATDRAGPERGLDLWRAPYDAGSFGAPEPVARGINTAADETDPLPLATGELVFASNRPRGPRSDFELYAAAAEADDQAVAHLARLCSPFDEREPGATADGRVLVFASDRAGIRGSFDLYQCARGDGDWLEPRPLEGLNSAASERGPLLSPDGFSLIFSRVPEGVDAGGADLVRARSRELFPLPPRSVSLADALVILALLLLALFAMLAKRWQGLEVIYRCFLASVLLHLLFLWYSRRVHPEGVGLDAPGEGADPSYRVRLERPVADAGSGAGFERSLVEAQRAPARAELGQGPLAALPEARALERAPKAERAPERAPVALAPGERSGAMRAGVAMELPSEAFEAHAEPGAGLALPAVAARALPERERSGPARASGASDAPAFSDARAPSPLPLASAAPPPLAPSSGPARASTFAPERAPRETAADSLVLRDGEAAGAAGPPRLAKAAPAFDATAGLAESGAGAPEAGMRARAAAPERLRRSAAEPASERAAAAPALALAGPPPLGRDKLPERLSHTPYRNRFGTEKAEALELYGGSVETEAAVARGLAYLASIQNADGSFGSAEDYHSKYHEVRIGKTGLALLAFLGAGHTPAADSLHADAARRAVEFLLGVQDPASGHFGDCSAYGHGIATYALAECYALTRDPRLQQPLERAVARIVAAQARREDERFYGGWGYYYPDGSIWNGDRWPRVSISAWQVMALESARLGGLAVDERVFEGARAFLANAWDGEQGAFRYNHDPGRLSSEYPILPASTPAAIFALSLLGVGAASAELGEARRFVLARAPSGYARPSDDAFVHEAKGNLYFWYYGTLALFRAGGNAWERWNAALKATLLPAQEENGSWLPIEIYAEYAGDDDGDRSYTTAMCVLSLEIYYRYFTPLLEVR